MAFNNFRLEEYWKIRRGKHFFETLFRPSINFSHAHKSRD